MSTVDHADSNDEFQHRLLCPDGSCIGVLDSQGMCKACGLVDSTATADPRLRSFRREEFDSETPAPGDRARSAEVSNQADAIEPTPSTLQLGDAPWGDTENSPECEESEAFERRQLCADGSCLGLVDARGQCNLCSLAGENENENENNS